MNVCVCVCYIVLILSLSDQSYMRLTAASGLLKLSRYGCSDYITMDQFQLLSTTAQV